MTPQRVTARPPGEGEEWWTAADIAGVLGFASPGVARSQLAYWRRAGWVFEERIDPTSMRKYYRPAEVLAARAASPGRGARVDLRRKRQGDRSA